MAGLNEPAGRPALAPRAVFLSYRRDDTIGYAGRLYDRLSATFGASNTFRDIDTLAPGVDVPKAIEGTIRNCRAVLVVIGRGWLTMRGPHGRRLDDPSDVVRLEIAHALATNAMLIPVLVDGATMPKTAELPQPISALADRNAVILSEHHWIADVNRLIESIADAVDPRSPTERSRDDKVNSYVGTCISMLDLGQAELADAMAGYALLASVDISIGYFSEKGEVDRIPVGLLHRLDAAYKTSFLRKPLISRPFVRESHYDFSGNKGISNSGQPKILGVSLLWQRLRRERIR